MARPGGQMPRFFTPSLDAQTITLDPGESAHATRVLRLNVGDGLELFDGHGSLAAATIREISKKQVICEVGEIQRHEPTRPQVIVAAPAAKADAAATMVDMLSQVGAAAWIPLATERSVVAPSEKKLEKWQRLAVESAKQCGRLYLLQVHPLTAFADVLQHPADDRRILLPPNDNHPHPTTTRENATNPTGSMLLLIGPEGGFTVDEIEAARDVGFSPWTLEPHVMRIETAAVVAAALALNKPR